MLNDTNYQEPASNLGKIVRKGYRKEWSYFFDAIIKYSLVKSLILMQSLLACNL